jgi:hypothetical protein
MTNRSRLARSLVPSAALLSLAAFVACGGGGGTGNTDTFGTGGAKTSTGTGGDGFLFTTSTPGTGTDTGSTGTGGAAPVCDGNPTSGPIAWARKNDDTDAQFGLAVATDAAGNVYLTGSYSGSLTIGSKTAEIANAAKALFVAKLGPDGSAQWVHGYQAAQIGLPAALATGKAIAVDSAGNVIVAGDFTGRIAFGATTIQSAGNFFGDIFLLQLDSAGNVAHVAQVGDPLATTPASGGSTQTARGLAVQKTPTGDMVALVGDSEGTLDIGGGKTFPGAGVASAFVAVYFSSGLQARWGALLGDGTAAQSTHAVAFDPSHDVVLTGNTSGALHFPGGTTVTPAGTQAAFVAKIKGDGSATSWAQVYGSGTAGGEAIAVGPGGDVYVAGDHQGDIDFGGGPLANKYGANVFVARLDNAGKHVWSRTYGDSTAQHARGLAVDAGGRAVLTGLFSGKIDFGGGALTSMGASDDIFVAKLDTHGCQVWAKSFGDTAEQAPSGLALDASGNALVIGTNTGATAFGSTTLTTAAGYYGDAFVLKIGP